MSKSSRLLTITALAAPLLLGGCIVAQPAPYYRQSYVAPSQPPVVYAEPAPVYYAPAPAYYGGPVVVFGGGGYRGGYHRGWR